MLRDPGSFNGKWYLETKICMLPVLVATDGSLLPSLFSAQSLEKRERARERERASEHENAYIKTHIVMSISIFLNL